MIASNLTRRDALRPGSSINPMTWRFGAVIAVLLGITTFLPYPAIAFGNTSALQIGNLLSLLLLIPALAMPWRERPIHLYLVILAPLVLSAVKVALTQTEVLDLCFKEIIVIAVTCVTLVITQLYAPRYSLQILTGIAAVTIVHVLVGLLQMYSFTLQEFPLADFYVNQSFFSVQDSAERIARYIQRPFGFFPEPSAMSSSLAPFVLFWLAELCGLVQLRAQPARWQRIVFGVAAIGGLGLIILSSSGHTVFTFAGFLVIGVLWLGRLRATSRTFALVLPTLGIFLPLLLWLAWTFMFNRIEGEAHTGGSWEDRSNSLLVGFSIYAHGDLPTIIFGIGTGLSPDAIWKAAGLEAVWSVSLCYLYETGLVGAIAIGAIGLFLVRVWRKSHLNPVFAIVVLVWLVGITLTTSYVQLLPIWVTLGWLTVWPEVCETAEPATQVSAEPHPQVGRRLRAAPAP